MGQAGRGRGTWQVGVSTLPGTTVHHSHFFTPPARCRHTDTSEGPFAGELAIKQVSVKWRCLPVDTLIARRTLSDGGGLLTGALYRPLFLIIHLNKVPTLPNGNTNQSEASPLPPASVFCLNSGSCNQGRRLAGLLWSCIL